MSSYTERDSTHEYVEAVWHKTADGSNYWVPADGCWDIIFAARPGAVRVFIAGHMTKARLTRHAKGTELFGIRFRPSVYMSQLPLGNLLNSRAYLHHGGPHHPVWLEGIRYELPADETAELFVSKLRKNNVLVRDQIIDESLNGQMTNLSSRSVQRHFQQTTGLTKKFIEQTKRVQLAEQLLKNNKPATQVASQVGYADQAHMTRSFRMLLGYTPSQLLHT
jgi:AraC-like DNA-binding protein